MRRDLFIKILLLTVVSVILVFIIFGVNFFYKFYNDIFRLSSRQIQETLSTKISSCKKIIDCKLLEGDILIRRYITERTWLVNKLAHPYFTHSAFYLGNDQIVEAVGTEKNPEDEIQIATLSKSDWFNNDVENWVIVRPKNITQKFNVIKNNLINIAKDKEYVFGLPEQGHKKFTCADLIFNQLKENSLVNISNAPKIISPDYLFSLAVQNPTNFEVVGYNIFIEK
ncbi:hypothetical protein A3A03_01595 [Candidatus Nomurabacteria bacterium RIFCSPLOWO2_01_FULL_40_18]|uniref:Permuted papain-like amidase YaeF/Yiix C92 family enzyme n=1 Tax=Candidatus Nomurabacteria bacterium RIFCSPLOWO2_01_FULL_40_18 TaxID=1801773 RepID=A0A1F6XKL9_9BACT|nr:MAG: hypothetical protein A3A03_01595 [Candidatus Nomurabacteria bacterium RIFCSPLOWO2_01_FULL_40_18]